MPDHFSNMHLADSQRLLTITDWNDTTPDAFSNMHSADPATVSPLVYNMILQTRVWMVLSYYMPSRFLPRCCGIHQATSEVFLLFTSQVRESVKSTLVSAYLLIGSQSQNADTMSKISCGWQIMCDYARMGRQTLKNN